MFQLSNVRPDSGSRLFGEMYFAQASAQEVFDFACEHLFRQRSKSHNEYDLGHGSQDLCVYRGPSGKMCAAGPFLDHVDGSKNTAIWDGFAHARHHPFIRALQMVHDEADDAELVIDWYSGLFDIAVKYRLYWNFSDWCPVDL